MSQRRARISEAGAGIFLTPADLRCLGVDPEKMESVAYVVEESGIRFAKRERVVTGD